MPTVLSINLHLLAALLISKERQANRRGLSLEVDIRSFELQSVAEETDLVEMAGELIGNAMDACTEGDILYVELRSTVSGRISLSVSNPGPELTPEFVENLFRRGYTTKSTRDGHQGLGMFRLRQVLDMYDGEIELANEKKNGKNYLRIRICV